MTRTVEAVYEDGVLKPSQPLPLREHERVRLTVQPTTGWVEETYGILGWKGDAETFERGLAEAEESGMQPFSRVE
jgi:predicted DNA-binding antitoxin AbrB/MazE fold protein